MLPLHIAHTRITCARIRERYESLLFLDRSFAASKDAEQNLWKTCFYKRIAEFRKRIQKYASAARADPAARDHCAKIAASFRAFLEESVTFYQSLLRKFQAQSLLQLGNKSSDNAAVQSAARCCIFLGDLARYAELHSATQKKDWSAADKHYKNALTLLPTNGNPHNQLAVLATYQDSECVAVYHYCRSLMVAQPFVTARENLKLLFDKNRQKVEKALQEQPAFLMTAHQGNSSTNPKGVWQLKAQQKSGLLKSFLMRFVRMHGMMYFALLKPKNELGNQFDIETFIGCLTAVISDFEALLQSNALSDAMLLKLVSICIFSAANSLDKKAAEDPTVDDNQIKNHKRRLLSTWSSTRNLESA